MAVVESRTRTVVGRQPRVTSYARNADAQTSLCEHVSVLLVPHRGRGACLVSDTPGVGREPLSSYTLPLQPHPSYPHSICPFYPSFFNFPLSCSLFPLPVPSISTLLQPAARLRVRSLDARITMRSKACIAYPDWYNNGRMYECVCMWLHMGPQGRGIRGMAKVRTHGRTTPIGEEGEDENGARFLPRARSCWNTAAPYVASLYTVERVTARQAAPSRAIPPAYF